jgi:phosphate transport system permease protein
MPIILKEGPVEFVTGTTWDPYNEIYNILPMIIGTFVVTLLSLIIAIPLGLGCAMLIAEVAPYQVRSIIRPAIETLAAIPSVIYGLFGLIVLVPFIRDNVVPFAHDYIGWIPLVGGLVGTQGNGFGVLAGGIILAIMILPTIISVSEDSLRAVPRELREGSLALGATKWQMITGIVTPAALSGIVAGAVLGMGRAIGETMAVLMVCGNSTIIPTSLLSMARPMTSAIALEWNYASGDHQVALFAIGIVLLIVIMILNLVIYLANRKKLNFARM